MIPFKTVCLAIIFVLISCRKELPTRQDVETIGVDSIQNYRALVRFTVYLEQPDLLMGAGICWDTVPNVGIDSGHSVQTYRLANGFNYSLWLEGLPAGTRIFVRAYAYFNYGNTPVYGNVLSFQTTPAAPFPGNGISDIDANFYKTVKIDGKEWMAENLRTSRYRDGTVIPTTADPRYDLTNVFQPKFRWSYQSDTSHARKYGLLYTAFVAQQERLCPAGWHTSTETEWSQLISMLGGESAAVLKLLDTINQNGFRGTGETGLALRAAGLRDHMDFRFLGSVGTWWAKTPFSNLSSTLMDITTTTGFPDGNIRLDNNPISYYGRSVRCVKD